MGGGVAWASVAAKACCLTSIVCASCCALDAVGVPAGGTVLWWWRGILHPSSALCCGGQCAVVWCVAVCGGILWWGVQWCDVVSCCVWVVVWLTANCRRSMAKFFVDQVPTAGEGPHIFSCFARPPNSLGLVGHLVGIHSETSAGCVVLRGPGALRTHAEMARRVRDYHLVTQDSEP